MKRLSKKTWTLVGAAGFLLIVVALVVGYIAAGATDTKTQNLGADREASAGESSAEGGEDGAGESSVEEEKTVTDASVTFDDDGYVEMAVTDDPREAAASAASVLMSVDSSKVRFAEDFRRETLARVMQPTESYVGAGDQFLVTTRINGESTVLNADEVRERQATAVASLTYMTDGWWWRLGDDVAFDAVSYRNAVVESQAIEVYNAEEIEEFADGESWTEFSPNIDVDVTKEGASMGLYWVRLASTTTADGETGTVRAPVALAIYCDAPEEGGVCGVAALMTGYPDSWQRQ